MAASSFYDRKEVKDLIAYMRALVNPDDDVSVRRVINEPKRGIGDTTVEKLTSFASENGYLADGRGARQRSASDLRRAYRSWWQALRI